MTIQDKLKKQKLLFDGAFGTYSAAIVKICSGNIKSACEYLPQGYEDHVLILLRSFPHGSGKS